MPIHGKFLSYSDVGFEYTCVIRVSSKSPGTSRKDYSILGDSPLDSNQQQQDEKQGGSKVRWKNNVEDGEHKGDREDKGHARSTSLDLNKMLLADSISDGVWPCMCVCVIEVCHVTLSAYHKELLLLIKYHYVISLLQSWKICRLQNLLSPLQ